MGYYFVAVREGRLSGGKLEEASALQLQKTARSLKRSIGTFLEFVDVIRFSGSGAGEETAKRLARALRTKGVLANRIFARPSPSNPLRHLYNELERLENDGVHWINVAVCHGGRIRELVRNTYRLSRVSPPGNTDLSPCEGVIHEQHEDWGFEVSLTFLPRLREDVITSTWRPSLRNPHQQAVGW